MFGVVNRGELEGSTEHEFEQLNGRLKQFLLVEHNDDGTHNFDLSQYATIEYVDGAFAPLVHTHAAADIVSGALAKARQHAQTAYKDEANVFTLENTFDRVHIGSGVGGARLIQQGDVPYLTQNVTNVGADWHLDDITKAGTLWALNYVSGLIYYNFTAGANPRSPTLRFQVDATGRVFEQGRGTPMGEWSAYTPTAANGITALGNGTLIGRYTLIGKTMHFWARLVVGNTTTFTGGILVLTTPLSMLTTTFLQLGRVAVFDASVGDVYNGGLELNSATQVYGRITTATTNNGAVDTASYPVIPGTGDQYVFSGTVELA